MNELFSSVRFWIDPFIVVIIASATLGMLGVLTTLRRSLFVPVTLAQTGALGVTVAFFLSELMAVELPPFPFALLTALGASALFAARRSGGAVAEAVLFIAASAGTILIGSFLRGDIHDVQGVLFGSAVLVSRGEMLTVAGVALPAAILFFALRRSLFAASFDPDSYAAAGRSPFLADLILYILLSVLIAVTTRALGTLLVFAATALPALAALAMGRSFDRVLVRAALVGACGGGNGFIMSWLFDLPTGATVAALLCLFGAVGMIAQKLPSR